MLSNLRSSSSSLSNFSSLDKNASYLASLLASLKQKDIIYE